MFTAVAGRAALLEDQAGLALERQVEDPVTVQISRLWPFRKAMKSPTMRIATPLSGELSAVK
jgi:hypothetical protein